MSPLRVILALLGAAGLACPGNLANAGSVLYDFDTDPRAVLQIVGNNPFVWQAANGNPASGGFLGLTYPVADQYTGLLFPDLDPGQVVSSFKFECDLRVGNSTGERPADGFSVSFARGNDPLILSLGNPANFAGGFPEAGATTGIAVSFDTWSGNTLPDGPDIEGIIVRVDNVTVLRLPLPTRHGACDDLASLQTGPRDPAYWSGGGNPYAPSAWQTLCWQPFSIELDAQAKLTVKYKNNTILDRFQTAYFPSVGRLILAGRTGGGNENSHLDNLRLTTVTSTNSPPDLTKSSDSLNRGSALPGDVFIITHRVINLGGTRSGATMIHYFLHKDFGDYTAASKIGELPLGDLNPGATSVDLQFNYVVPATILPGSYYLAYWIDAPNAVAESNENNNQWQWSNLQIGPAGPPDLTRFSDIISRNSGSPGDLFTAWVMVVNAGASRSLSTVIHVYLHKDFADYSTSSKIGEIPLGELPAGATSPDLPFSYRFPEGTATGTYYLAYWIDAANTVAESNESNNQWLWPILQISGTRSTVLSDFKSSTSAVEIQLTDGDAPVNGNSVILKIDSQNVTPVVIQSNKVTTIVYQPSSPLVEGSTHRATLTVFDTAVPPVAKTFDFGFAVGISQPSSLARPDFWVPKDGGVNALLETNGIVYIGGQFSYVGPYTGGGAAVNLTFGELDTSYPIVGGSVNAVVSDGRGGWYIGGGFESVGGLPRTNLVHILRDKSVALAGKLDPDLGINVMSVVGNTLYVGGYFRRIGDKTRNQLAAIDIPTDQVLDWIPTVEGLGNGKVKAMAASGNTVFVVFSGQGDRISAVDATTAQAITWNIPSGEYFSVVVACGKVYLGGPNLLALDPVTGVFRTPGNLNFSGGIGPLAAADTTVYMTGGFISINGQPRTHAAAFDAHSEKLTDWAPVLDANGYVYSLAVSGNTVYMGGSFQSVGGFTRKGLASVDGATGKPTRWEPKINHPLAQGQVYSLGVSEDTVYFGGNVGIGGQPRKNLAALDTRTGQLIDWNPIVSGPVFDLTISGNVMFVGGAFTNIDGQARTNLAALDLASGHATAWRSDCYDPDYFNPFLGSRGYVGDLAVARGTVFVEGLFTIAGGANHRYLAAVDAQTGLAKPWNLDLPQIFGNLPNDFAMAASEKTVYLAGPFGSIGGKPRNSLAAVDADSGLLTGWAPSLEGQFPSALAVAVSENTVYVGGSFTSVGGRYRRNIAALDPGTGQATDWYPQASGELFPIVQALAVRGNTVFAGGHSSFVGGQLWPSLVGINTVTGNVIDWNPKVFAVGDLAVSGSTVFAAGYDIGGLRRPMGVFPPEGAPFFIRQPQRQTVPFGQTISLEATALGAEPLFYQWQKDRTNLVGATNATLSITIATVLNSGTYRAVVTNVMGLVHSSDALVVALDPPKVQVGTLPVPDPIPPGSATLFAEFTGHPPPSFQWRLNGVNIPGATGPTLMFTNAQPTDGGSFSVVVANIGGTASSDAFQLVWPSPSLALADNVLERFLTNSFSGVGNGANTNATKELGEPDHAGKLGSRSVWLAWQAPTNGIATFHTRGSSFDTLLAVYTNASPADPFHFTNLVAVASDDDRGNFLTSEVFYNAAAGTEYLIAMDGFGRASGNLVLSWNLEPTISEVPRIFQPPNRQTAAAGEDASFSVTAFSSRPLSYQWFLNCLPIAGATNAALTVTNVQPKDVGSYLVRVSNGEREVESLPAFLEINFAGSGGAAQKVASRDKLGDLAELGPSAGQLTLNLVGTDSTPSLTSVGLTERTPGTRWNASLPGSRAQGAAPPTQGILTLTPPDSPRTAQKAGRGKPQPLAGIGGAPARGLSGAQTFNTFGYRKQIGEPNHCGEAGGASAWYAVQAEDNGLLLVSTEGSSFDTVVAVYAGPENALGFDELQMPAVACDNNSGFDRRTSRVVFPANKNQVYHVAVDGVNGVEGTVKLSWQLGLPPAITVLPGSQTVRYAGTVTLSVGVTNTPPWFFQWRFNGAPIPGATNATLTLINVQPEQAGRYSVVAGNFAGTVTSDEIPLEVGPRLFVHGKVTSYASGWPVAGVTLSLSGDRVAQAESGLDGAYSFAVGAGGNYVIVPGKPDDSPASLGVTTLDITLVRRHILGLAALDSPYKVLAADVNQSDSITTLDITLMRRVILGITNTYPAGVWKFVPSNLEFPNPTAPWGVSQSRTVQNPTADVTGQDFIAIKLGDVNTSWAPP